MIRKLAENLVKLKQEFSKTYDGTSHIQEIIPLSKSDAFPVNEKELDLIHNFAKNNPIYYDSYETKISNISCVVYEGDINRYWLNSVQHGLSKAPFSPTWIFSAYLNSLCAKENGFSEIVDIGSGDGRIAYCAKILGMGSHSIEIDETLIELQNSISNSTKTDFNSICSDATTFDYTRMRLKKPAFFVGGLAQMGGISLATGVFEQIKNNSILKEGGMVFTGTDSQKYSTDPLAYHGWGTLIHNYNLDVITTLVLPTVWTFTESLDTPYVFTKFTIK